MTSPVPAFPLGTTEAVARSIAELLSGSELTRVLPEVRLADDLSGETTEWRRLARDAQPARTPGRRATARRPARGWASRATSTSCTRSATPWRSGAVGQDAPRSRARRTTTALVSASISTHSANSSASVHSRESTCRPDAPFL